MGGQCSFVTESLGSLGTKNHCQKCQDECQENQQDSHYICPAEIVKNVKMNVKKERYLLHLSGSRPDCILCRLVGSKSLSVTLVCNFCQNKLVVKAIKYLRSGGSRGEKQERGKGEGESEHFGEKKLLKSQALDWDAQWLPAAVSQHSGATSGATFFYTNCKE